MLPDLRALRLLTRRVQLGAMAEPEPTKLHVAIVGMVHWHFFTIIEPSIDCTSGAGIAGLALAIGLHNRRISFTLYEEAPQYSAVG